MEKQSLRFASDGDPSLLILEVPSEFARSGETTACVAFPILARRGGMTLAVPLSAFDPEKLVDELQREEEGLIGPSKSFVSEMVIEDDAGNPVLSEKRCRFLVIDFDDTVLPLLTEFDGDHNPETVVPFDSDVPGGVPVSDGLADEVRAWASSQNVGRVVFYSARDEPDVPGAKASGTSAKKATPKKVTNAMLVEQMSQLAAQVQALSSLQQNLVPPPTLSAAAASEPAAGSGIAPKMPSVIGSLGGGVVAVPQNLGLLGQASKAVGLPPRSRSVPKVPQFPAKPATVAPVILEEGKEMDPGVSSTDPMVNALVQQSSALTALVAHLAAGQDPLQELHLTGGSGAASSTRSVQKREKLQSELANGQSQFFVQVMQQMHRRLHPARPVPTSEDELASTGISMLSYLERTGGYRNQRELGTIMWILGHAMDCLIQNDVHMAREHLALLVCSLEQAAVDAGQWNLAFLISLSEEPPVQLYQDRISSMTQAGRPFAPLIPASWCAIALSYLKELEILTNRKTEVVTPKVKAVAKAAPGEESPSPRRRPRYPKKPKADPKTE